MTVNPNKYYLALTSDAFDYSNTYVLWDAQIEDYAGVADGNGFRDLSAIVTFATVKSALEYAENNQIVFQNDPSELKEWEEIDDERFVELAESGEI
jgi:hypothetical protein